MAALLNQRDGGGVSTGSTNERAGSAGEALGFETGVAALLNRRDARAGWSRRG